jgi:hypothetical protein
MKRNIASLRITDKDIKTQKINDTIGFNMHFKNENYIVFKTKNFFEKRSTGSRCDQKQTENTIEIFEKMYKQHSSELYDFLVEERKQQKAVLENKKLLCILQEFIFYIFNEKKVNGKIWYIDPVQSTLSNIENLGA